MKKLLFAWSAICFCAMLSAQIAPQLERALQAQPQDFHPISIYFHPGVDLQALAQKLRAEQSSAAERARAVNRALLRQAQITQGPARRLLADAPPQMLRDYRAFYLVNEIVAVAKPKLIYRLAELPEVAEIQLEHGYAEIEEPLEVGQAKSAAGMNTESGLRAINAPAMWQRGYTGRGQKVYVYDTGVWADHPSFAQRFLGHYGSMKAAWFGLFSPEPSGFLSNHGTHVLGTIAGLDTAAKDTIGLAWGAYWMANDHINGTAAAVLPPKARMIEAFEWALNPDGDTNTVEDIPAVINNSWRWRDSIDLEECSGSIPNLMLALETAGIANVFAAGNTGPANQGIRSPQRIILSKLNTFTVGSVNGNQPFPPPISPFSSRGPTQCPGTDSLQTYPTVVAPGQFVRSAWNSDSYNTISGTSMAAPHVAGACLLLKEAFPTLPGEELLKALYLTAIDLGATGEDNTFGNGLIDVDAAFQFLALSHSPVDPRAVDWDLAIQSTSSPSAPVSCDSSYTPRLVLVNLGDSTIHSITLEAQYNGQSLPGSPFSFSTAGLGQKGDTQSIHLPVVALSGSGLQEFRFAASMGQAEYDHVNNVHYRRFQLREDAASFPFSDDFENGWQSNPWRIDNPDFGPSWDTVAINGWLGNERALWINYHEYAPRESQKDQLQSPIIALPATGQPLRLAFNVAYQQRGPIASLQDSLRIFVSTDCGTTFQMLYEKAGEALRSVENYGINFSPGSPGEWRRDTVDLSAFAGSEVVIAFEGTNRNGNNLYLDNISVYAGHSDPLLLNRLQTSPFSVFPNPVEHRLHIQPKGNLQRPVFAEVQDLQGRIVLQNKLPAEGASLSMASLPKGMYQLILRQGGDTWQQIIIKN